MRVGVVFSTKDRTEFTAQTLPRILDEAEGNFDLFWLDGSVTQKGVNFPAEFAYKYRNEHDGKYPLKALHQNAGGGPAAVIQAAWKFMYDQGYDYIGLIENDVLLEPGWFRRCMGLFDIGSNVGAVSARCFTDRILDKHEDFAVMANVGAGMHIAKRDLVMPLLENWRKPMLWEMEVFFQYYLKRPYPIPTGVKRQDPELKQNWLMTEDWYWEVVLLSKGYSTLACIPSLARNLDDLNGERDRVER